LVCAPAVDEDGQPGTLFMLEPGDVYSMIEGYGLVPYETAELPQQATDNDSRTNEVVHIRKHGNRIPVEIADDSTVHDLKLVVAAQTDTDIAALRMSYAGRLLHDDELVSSYGIRAGADITTWVAGVGGAPPAKRPRETATDFSILASDHVLVKTVLSERAYDLKNVLKEMEYAELQVFCEQVGKEKEGKRIVERFVEIHPELKDAEAFVSRMQERIETCRDYIHHLVKEDMTSIGWYEAGVGFDNKKVKTYLNGVLAVCVCVCSGQGTCFSPC
jgi:hypothetical protein